MRSLQYLLVIVILLSFSNINPAQNLSNLRRKILICDEDSIKIDSNSIIPGSVKLHELRGQLISEDKYIIDYVNALLICESIADRDSFEIEYRIFPYSFSESFSHKKLIEADLSYVESPEAKISYQPNFQTTNEIGYSRLNKSGTIARGITVGNSQNLILNSNLDLRLSGKLTNDIEILAALSDKNIPLQPEGNTSKLQDIDRVFIQLSSKRSKVIFGDYLLNNNPDNYFLRYHKKTQGVLFEDNLLLKNNISVSSGVSFSLSRGKYGRNTFNGEEGNQGPYKLSGNDGETHITVIAGTEKVYLNGELLYRGEQNDFVIDYNRGEIIFTTNRIISNYDRLIIEFQYADRVYERSIFQISNAFHHNNWKIAINLYSEQDNKNKTLFGNLDSSELAILNNIGDSLESAIIHGGDSIAYDSNIIMYKKIDTLGFNAVFVYSINPDSAHYQVKFSYVGKGKGNYIQEISIINGKILKWVKPVNNIPQGEYEPIKKIISPKKRQLLTLGGKYKISEKGSVGFELSVSNVDQNILSDINDADNQGIAAKLFINNTFDINKKKKWKLFGQLDYEFKGRNFYSIERYRNVEFERNWNRQLSNQESTTGNFDENLGNILINLSKDKQFTFKNLFSIYQKENDFSGISNNLGLVWKIGKFNLQEETVISKVSNKLSPNYQSDKNFTIHTFDLSRDFRFFKLGSQIHYEVNEHRDHSTDSLESISNKHYEWRVYLKNSDTLSNKFELNFSQRNDFLPLKNSFTYITQSNKISLSTELINLPNKQLRCLLKYSNFIAFDSNYLNYQSGNTFLVNLEGNFSIRNFIRSSTYYQIGSGKEQKKEFYFIEVDKGKGNYIHNDYNDNGIRELDEFEEANFQDEANYIRIITPTNDYVTAITNEFQQNLLIQAPSSWKKRNQINKLIGKFSNQASFRITRKLLDNKILDQYNPFLLNISDTSLLTINSNLRNSIFFNRNNPNFGMEFSWLENKRKTLLFSGFNTRIKEEAYVKLRINISQTLVLYPEYFLGEKVNYMDYAPTRDYLVNYQYIKSKLSFNSSSKFRMSIEYIYKDYYEKIQKITSKHDQLGLSTTYSILSKGIIKVSLNWINIKYSENENSSIAYEMLEGFKNGVNYYWELYMSYHLQNNILINLHYNGRKPSGISTIHTGSINVRYLF